MEEKWENMELKEVKDLKDQLELLDHQDLLYIALINYS